MDSARRYAAVDLGASSGRVLLGRWDGDQFALTEMHRFANGPVETMGELHWDVLSIWAEIKAGLARCAPVSGEPGRLAGVGVDTWGVDYALLDRDGRLLGNPYHYRNSRTDGILEHAFELVPRAALYEETGIVPMQINTIFQLFSMVRSGDPRLEAAAMLLPMPNLFSHWLTGRHVAEYTHATTTQCLSVRDTGWAAALLTRFGIPAAIFPPIVAPGTVLGPVLADVAAEVGLAGGPTKPASVIAVGCHDTASAVAAIPGLDSLSAYISSGTWSLMGVETAAPIVTERALAGGFTNEGGVGGTVRLLRNIPGLWLLQQCRRRWQRDGHDYGWDELIELARKAEPLVCLVDPDAAEFQNPPDMPAAIAAYCRRTGQPHPGTVGAVARCCLESLAALYRATFADLQEVLGRPLDTIRIVGGGSRNGLLCQLAADACGVPVVAGPTEATALGNVMIQAIAMGELDDIGAGRAAVAASVALRTYEPQPGAAWDDKLARLRSRAAGAAQ